MSTTADTGYRGIPYPEIRGPDRHLADAKVISHGLSPHPPGTCPTRYWQWVLRQWGRLDDDGAQVALPQKQQFPRLHYPIPSHSDDQALRPRKRGALQRGCRGVGHGEVEAVLTRS